MHQSVSAALSGFRKQYEGKVNFMYLDVNADAVGNSCDMIHGATADFF